MMLCGDVGGCGEEGLLTCVGDMGAPPRGVLELDAPFAFFLPPNDRRNDHSPSNWMESNSLDAGL